MDKFVTKEELLTLLKDNEEFSALVLSIVEEQLGDLVELREYLDNTLDR